MSNSPRPQAAFLRVEDLVKTYQDGEVQIAVLRGVTLSAVRGEILAIVGPSGAGKSTLLHLLGGLDRPDSGRITYGDLEITRLSDQELVRFRCRSIGFVFQFHHLLPDFTALENVALAALIGGAPREEAFRRARELLETVGLGERENHLPTKLSGGERQRVALARALVNEPEVVLADEPTGNLDRKTGEAIHDLIWNLRERTHQTFVLVTHNPTLAKRADRIVELVDGQIVEPGQWV
ncbi:MAG: lipoprotein-releasing system ATP-binding protein LolD [Candidatus Poribacteria bacterium]|nr:MAG: lipoprotein-releasing system ATP-binding protein LolD [Candidatus Poribacteria bacterium]